MEESKKSTRRFLVIYSLAIFTFAVALILIASFSQMRINREADAIQTRLTNAELLAADKQTRLDAVMTENTRLNNQIKQLETQNSTLTNENNTLKTQKDEITKKQTAAEKFIEIIILSAEHKEEELKTAIQAFEEAGSPALLSPANVEIYNSIKESE